MSSTKSKEIPGYIKDALQDAATKYSESKATTNAGIVLRTIAKVIPLSLVIKLFSHKLKNPQA